MYSLVNGGENKKKNKIKSLPIISFHLKKIKRVNLKKKKLMVWSS